MPAFFAGAELVPNTAGVVTSAPTCASLFIPAYFFGSPTFTFCLFCHGVPPLPDCDPMFLTASITQIDFVLAFVPDEHLAGAIPTVTAI